MPDIQSKTLRYNVKTIKDKKILRNFHRLENTGKHDNVCVCVCVCVCAANINTTLKMKHASIQETHIAYNNKDRLKVRGW